jgi:phage-related baseplate assembly protein
MAGSFTQVNLSQLPPPDVVETIDYEQILALMLEDLRERDPVFTALVESDPAYKVLEVAAYREVLLRQRVNDAAKAVMLSMAIGSDLDQIGANYGVQRLVVTPGDPSAIPPVPDVMESDEAFRNRIQLSLEGYTSAGSEGSYIFHALGASGQIRDVQAVSPVPGDVVVYVLPLSAGVQASDQLLEAVREAVNAERVRPMTDRVTVLSATIVPYTIEAELSIYPGPDVDVVRQTAEEAAALYVEQQRRIGYDVTLSGIYAALHQPGVQNVNLISPVGTVTIEEGESSHCTQILLTASEATDV